MKKSTVLRNILKNNDFTPVPGAATALMAYLVELAGFEVVYATGAGVANMNWCVPDCNMISMYENLEIMKRMNDATTLPLLADIDNGYGSPLNVYRTTREYTKCGIAALQLEDQQIPKKCGHFEGKGIITKEEMVQKIKAAKDGMIDPDTVLIARTDSIAVNGFDDAVERAHAYLEAGADILFVEAPTSADMLSQIPQRIKACHLANMVEGGRTPIIPDRQLKEMGFKLALYANAPLKAAIKGVKELLAHLRAEGTTATADHLMVSMAERNVVTKFGQYKALEDTYR